MFIPREWMLVEVSQDLGLRLVDSTCRHTSKLIRTTSLWCMRYPPCLLLLLLLTLPCVLLSSSCPRLTCCSCTSCSKIPTASTWTRFVSSARNVAQEWPAGSGRQVLPACPQGSLHQDRNSLHDLCADLSCTRPA
eukprot:766518-Hanusia_phi.AAC.4